MFITLFTLFVQLSDLSGGVALKSRYICPLGSLLAGALQDISSLQVLLVVVAVFHGVSVLTVALCVEESVHAKSLSKDDYDVESRQSLFRLV